MMPTCNVWTISKSKKNEPIKTSNLFTPSPIKYDPIKPHKINAPSWKFPNSNRESGTKKPLVPGPGHYKIEDLIGKESSKFTISQKLADRSDLTKLVVSPGPCNYQINYAPRLKSASKYTIGKRPKTANPQNEPLGPGSYNFQSNLKKPSYKFDKTPRILPPGKNHFEAPAPNRYTIKSEFGNNKNQITFAKESRIPQSKSEVPGPGNYKTFDLFGKEGSKYTISKTAKEEMVISNENPGPGAYNLNLNNKSTAPSYLIGNAKRVDKSVEMKLFVPDPTAYNPKLVDKTTLPSWVFGKSMRENNKKNQKWFIPPPGQYDVKSLIGKEGPKYSFRPKTTESKKSELKIPGPTDYNNEKIQFVREKTPSWVIGKSKREDSYKWQNKKIVPGPGNYNIKSSLTGPFAKIHSKLQIKPNLSTPGPGHYKIPCSFRDVPYYTAGSFDNKFRWV